MAEFRLQSSDFRFQSSDLAEFRFQSSDLKAHFKTNRGTRRDRRS
jgi:hypothetical protein